MKCSLLFGLAILAISSSCVLSQAHSTQPMKWHPAGDSEYRWFGNDGWGCEVDAKKDGSMTTITSIERSPLMMTERVDIFLDKKGHRRFEGIVNSADEHLAGWATELTPYASDGYFFRRECLAHLPVALESRRREFIFRN